MQHKQDKDWDATRLPAAEGVVVGAREKCLRFDTTVLAKVWVVTSSRMPQETHPDPTDQRASLI